MPVRAWGQLEGFSGLNPIGFTISRLGFRVNPKPNHKPKLGVVSGDPDGVNRPMSIQPGSQAPGVIRYNPVH